MFLLLSLMLAVLAQTPTVPVTIMVPVVQGPKGDPGPAGPPGPTPIQPSAVFAGQLPGVDASLPPWNVGSGVDDSAALDTLIGSLDPGKAHTIRLPAAALKFNSPLVIHGDNIRIVGAGMGETDVYIDPGLDPYVIGNLDPSTYAPASRPDLFNLLDSSVAPIPGKAWGFDTLGRNFVVEKGCGLSFGRYDRTAKAWDYWENPAGFTIGLAVGGTPGTGKPLCGVGGYQSGASPYYVTTGNAGEIWLNYRLAGDGPANRAIVLAGFDFGGARTVNRYQLSIDGQTGAIFGFVNGAPAAPTFINPPATFQGFKFAPNDHDKRFSVGGGLEQAPTAFQLLALTVWDVAVPTWAGADGYRYPSDGPGVVGGLNTSKPESKRLVYFTGGLDAAPNGSYGVVWDSQAPAHSVSGTKIEGQSCHNGGVALAGVLDTDLNDLDCQGGRSGLDVFPVFANYRLRSRNCVFGGDTGAVKLYETLGTVDGANLKFGGLASVVDTSCSVTWTDTVFTGYGPRQKRAIDLLAGMYAGQERWLMPTINAEYLAFSDEIFRCENTVGCLRGLTVLDGAAGGIAPSGVVFRLVSAPAGSGAFPAKVNVSGFGMPPCSAAASVEGVTGEWIGSIDVRQCPYLPGAIGAGFDPAKLAVTK